MTCQPSHDPDREAAVEVDARGQRCPLPVIELARAIAAVPAGRLVRLLATDPAAGVDVPAFCRLRGLELVGVSERGEPPAGHTAYLVRRLTATEPAGGPPGPA